MSAEPRHLFMTADAVGGVWTYALDLAGELGRTGVRTTLAVLGPPPSREQRREAAGIGVRVFETDLELDWLAENDEQLDRAGKRLALMAAESGADLVHLNSPALAVGAGFTVPILGACHSCLATWWDAVRGGRLPRDFAWKTERLAKGYAACDALIAPSYAFMQATAARYGLAPRVVRNGRRPGGRRHDPALKRPFVFSAGRLWDDGKSAAFLDAVAGRTRWPVYAAGPLVHPDGSSRTLAHAVPVGALPAPQVTDWLSHAAVFASFSAYEPFGLAVLEAAQAGCALVLSDIPTHRELWEGAAMFVEPGDEAAAADVLDRLVGEPELCARLGALALERAAAFSAEAMAAETLAIYRELLAVRAFTGAAA